MEAWGLLYFSFLRAGFIPPNPYHLHFPKQAAGPNTAVVAAKDGEWAVGTISAIGDGPKGLPVEDYFPAEVNSMRLGLAKMVEIGMLGDNGVCTGKEVVYDLMRWAFWFAISLGASHIVCSTPEKRISLYDRIMGFKQIGAVKPYGEKGTIVLLSFCINESVKNQEKHRAIKYFVDNPVQPLAFDGRFGFDRSDIEGTTIMGRLKEMA